MIKKEIYINNMNKFLKEINATNEQITIIINVYTSYLNSFYNNVDIVILLNLMILLRYLILTLRRTHQI